MKTNPRYAVILRTKVKAGEYVTIFTPSKSGALQHKETYLRTGTSAELFLHIKKRYKVKAIDVYNFSITHQLGE
jgi:hypothetical protein